MTKGKNKTKNSKEEIIQDKAKTIVWTVLASQDDYEAQYDVEKLLNELIKELNVEKLNKSFQGATKL